MCVCLCVMWSDHIDRVHSNSPWNNEVGNFNFSIRNRSCIQSEPGMQLLLSSSCASSSFDSVVVFFYHRVVSASEVESTCAYQGDV